MSSTLILPTALCEHLASKAREASPNECCGLIEGVATSEGWRVLALHASKNLAADPAREFLIDPQMHFELLRTLRETDRAIIGCYHSHPNGLSQPSQRDRREATDDNFVWLIVANDAVGAYSFNAAAREFVPLRLCRSA